MPGMIGPSWKRDKRTLTLMIALALLVSSAFAEEATVYVDNSAAGASVKVHLSVDASANTPGMWIPVLWNVGHPSVSTDRIAVELRDARGAVQPCGLYYRNAAWRVRGGKAQRFTLKISVRPSAASPGTPVSNFLVGVGEWLRYGQTVMADQPGGSTILYAMDWNDDGRVDVYNSRVYLRQADGTFRRTDIKRRYGRGQCWVDWDGDGDRDIVVGSRKARKPARWYENIGANTRTFRLGGEFQTTDGKNVFVSGHDWPTVLAFDEDGDGDKELFIGEIIHDDHFRSQGTKPGHSRFVFNRFVNAGGDKFERKGFLCDVNSNRIELEGYTNAAMADWEGDGDVDLFFSSSQGFDCVMFCENVGSPRQARFAAPRRLDASPGTPLRVPAENEAPGNVAVADWDGDGDLDVLVWAGRLYLAENVGTRTKPRLAPPVDDFVYQESGRLRGHGMVKVEVADWDGDGDLDLLLGEGGSEIALFENVRGDRLSPVFAAPQPLEAETNPRDNYSLMPTHPKRIRILDVKHGSPRSKLRTAVGATIGEAGYNSPALVDMDGDGDLDLPIQNTAGPIYYYENIGTRVKPRYAFRARLTDTNGHTIRTVWRSKAAWGDFDGDGIVDLMNAKQDWGSLSFYRGRATRPGHAPVFDPPVRVRHSERTIAALPTILRTVGAGQAVCRTVFADGVVRVKMRRADSSGWAGGIVMRHRDVKNYLYLRLSDATPHPNRHDLRLYAVVNGSRTLLGRASPSYDDMAWHEIALSVSGRDMAVHFDGRKLFEAKATGKAKRLMTGRAGLMGHYEHALVSFRDCVIQPAGKPEVKLSLPSAASLRLDLYGGSCDAAKTLDAQGWDVFTGKWTLMRDLADARAYVQVGCPWNADRMYTHGDYVYARGRPKMDAVDWDGDGDLDILIGKRRYSVTWIENVGDKRRFDFLPERTLFLRGGRPIHLCYHLDGIDAADWDKDSHPDLFVGNESGLVKYFSHGFFEAAPPVKVLGIKKGKD